MEIDYKPRNWADQFHNSLKRWIVIIICRRAGKTTAVLNHLQKGCAGIRDSKFAYIAPSYKMAKRIAWDIVKSISRDIPGKEYNEAELTIKYPNGSKLYLLGSENVDSLRGMSLWGVAFDEYAQHPQNLFSEVISKCLADHLGYAIFVGTPKGKGLLYQTYKTALAGPEKWTVIYKTIDDLLREEEGETINNLKKALEDEKKLVAEGLMSQDEFNQEWYCSFEASIKGAYYSEQIAEARREGRIKAVPYDKALRTHIVLDLGVGQALAAGFYQRIGREVHKIDYWEGEGQEGIPSAIKVFQNKPYIYGKIFVPHDATGTEQSTEKTRLQTLKELWPQMASNVLVVPKIFIDDGIGKAKLMFSRLWIDINNCSNWLDLISQYRREFDEERKMFVERPYHDFTSHAADELRYAALVENRMDNEWPLPQDYWGSPQQQTKKNPAR